MPKQAGKVLPAGVEEELSEAVKKLRTFLWLITEGTSPAEAYERAGLRFYLDPAITAAQNAAGDKAASTRVPAEKTLDKVISDRLKRVRTDGGWTQADFAAQVARLTGLPWKRQTVAEIETGLRKVSLDELLLIAFNFDVPMVDFFLPTGQDVVTVRDELVERALDRKRARAVVLGKARVGAEIRIATSGKVVKGRSR